MNIPTVAGIFGKIKKCKNIMINKDNLKDVLLHLEFVKEEQAGKLISNLYCKYFSDDIYLKVDFDSQELIFPKEKGLRINTATTCNFSQNENFVVFECIYRLLKQGYKPQHIELEPKWKMGHEQKSGRADILVKDFTNKPLLIIECKTPGKEFEKEWETMKQDGGQLFSYLKEERNTKFISLYTSDFENNNCVFQNYIITTTDIQNLVEKFDKKPIKPMFYKDATNAKELFKAWKETYKFDYKQQGIFGDDFQPYNIGFKKITLNSLQYIGKQDIQNKYNEFAKILRQHNVSGRENAFDKLVNLFLCKIVDETENKTDLKFNWKGEYFDNYFDLLDRLQHLYSEGMRRFLEDEVTYIEFKTVKEAFKFWTNDPDATQDAVLKLFKQQKYFTNNDFSFIDVHNEKLFFQNADILLKIIKMWENYQINGEQQNQFLGDMFEGFLDKGVKQSEGQFFTPMPICKFIISSLPLENLIKDNENPPTVIDYACGAGHFLTEFAAQIRPHVGKYKNTDIKEYYKSIYGIEKEYRLSKVAKVSAFMYGMDEINILYADALAYNERIKENYFNVLIANPPYSVKGFLETIENDRDKYILTTTVDPKSFYKNNTIETFFIERAKQLLKPNGIVGIILPTSILSKGSQKSTSDKENTYVATREILFKYFEFVAIAEFGSGTFGKTGTTTAILFLRKRDDNPEPAEHYKLRVDLWFKNNKTRDFIYEDVHLLKKYCEHIDINIDDYKTLLEFEPNEKLLNFDLFKEYTNDFVNSKDTKNLKESYQKQLVNVEKNITSELNKELKSSKTKTSEEELKAKIKELVAIRKTELQTELETELEKRHIEFIQNIEKDKVLYFILAYTNQQKVLVIKSPDDNKEKKNFLGYEWSDRKGKEGIKFIGVNVKTTKIGNEEEDDDSEDENIIYNIEALSQIKTPLYDNQNSQNTEKINYYIQQNFLGNDFEIPENLQKYVSHARLVDMLDFKRKNFDKVISLSPKITIEISTKWELTKIQDFVDTIESGKRPEGGVGNYTSGAWSLGGEHIHATLGTVDLSTPKYVPIEFYENCEKGKLKENDILICKDGALTGKVAMLRNELNNQKAMINEHVFIIRCPDLTKQKYLFNFLFSDIGQKLLKTNITGAAQGGLNSTNLKNIKIANPKFEIQQKIVEEIEILNNECNNLRNKLVELQNQVEVKYNSLGGDLKKLEDIAEDIFAGGDKPDNFSEIKTEKYNIPIFSNSSQNFGLFGYTDSAKVFKPCVTVSARGTIGYTVARNEPFVPIVRLIVIIPKSDVVLTKYLEFVLNKYSFFDSGANIPQLTVPKISNVQINVPNFKIQKEFVKEIEKLELEISEAAKIINEANNKKNEIIKKYM